MEIEVDLTTTLERMILNSMMATKQLESIKNGVDRLANKITVLQHGNETLQNQLSSWEEREAACCPEDFGFEEYIAFLKGNQPSEITPETSNSVLRREIFQMRDIAQNYKIKYVLANGKLAEAVHVIKCLQGQMFADEALRAAKEFFAEYPELDVEYELKLPENQK